MHELIDQISAALLVATYDELVAAANVPGLIPDWREYLLTAAYDCAFR